MPSEFGKGQCYCLGLYIMHEKQKEQYKKDYESVTLRNGRLSMSWCSLWVNGASDHLGELDTTYQQLVISDMLKSLKNNAFRMRSAIRHEVTEEEVTNSLTMARGLLKHIYPEFKPGFIHANWRMAKYLLMWKDMENNIEVEQAGWE